MDAKELQLGKPVEGIDIVERHVPEPDVLKMRQMGEAIQVGFVKAE